MATLESLTEAQLQQAMPAGSLRKARGYLGAVTRESRSGQTLTAQVRGNRSYDVEIVADEAGLHARCRCPHHGGGYCQHVGAVLLKWLQSPAAFTVLAAAAGHQTVLDVIPVDPPKSYRPKEEPPWRTRPFALRQQRDRAQLEQWLEKYRLQTLRDIGRQNQWPLRGTTKSMVVGQLADRLTNAAEMQKLVDGLDETQRRVFQGLVLLERGAYYRTEELERVVQGLGWPVPAGQISRSVHDLVGQGLVVEAAASLDVWAAIPFAAPAVMRVLPPLLDDIAPADAVVAQPGSQVLTGDATAFGRTVTQLLLLLEQGNYALRPPQARPRLEKFYKGLAEWRYDPEELRQAALQGRLQSGGAGKPGSLALAVPPPEPALPDEVGQRLAPLAGDGSRLDWYYHLLVAAGVLQPGSPVTAWPEVKIHFLRLDEAGQWAMLARLFFDLEAWSEFWEMVRADPTLQLRRVVSYAGQKPRDLALSLVRFRRLVLRLLACLPNERWLAFEELDQRLRPLWPRLDGNSGRYSHYASAEPSWYITRDDRWLRTDQEPAAWNLLQGQFARRLISGPLRWLGLADVCLAAGQLAAFRLHGLDDLYWDRVDVPARPPETTARAAPESPPRPVTVQDGRITLDPAAISAQGHSFLDHLARLEETKPGHFVYQVQAQAVHATFEAGLTPAELERQWQQHLGGPMPASLQALLAGWWQQYGRLRLYENVTLIEFGDDYALAEMKAVTSLGQRLLAEISPRLVLVPAEAVAILTTELQQAGYTAKQTDEA